MKKSLLGLCFGLTLVSIISTEASAHHAAALLYDTNKDVTIEGVVIRFELGNPHMRIYFTREDDAEVGREWMAEGGSRTVLIRRGWTDDMLKPGDRIVMHGHASRDERPIFHVVNMEMPDGREIGTEDSISTNLVDELRRRRRE